MTFVEEPLIIALPLFVQLESVPAFSSACGDRLDKPNVFVLFVLLPAELKAALP